MKFHWKPVVVFLIMLFVFLGAGVAILAPFGNPWFFIYSLVWGVFQFGFLMPNEEKFREWAFKE